MALPPVGPGGAAPSRADAPTSIAQAGTTSALVPADTLESVQRDLKLTGDAVKGARFALEPPKTAPQLREASKVPKVAKDGVTEDWVKSTIATMQQIASNPKVPNAQRAEANVIAASAESLILKHFTEHFWDKAKPGRRAIGDLQQALAQDPKNEAAAIAYTFTLMGIHNTFFKGKAEEAMGLRTGPELARVLPLLAAHQDSLLAQTLVGPALKSLEKDGPLPATLAQLTDGLDARVARLRGQDQLEAANVDEQMREFTK